MEYTEKGVRDFIGALNVTGSQSREGKKGNLGRGQVYHPGSGHLGRVLMNLFVWLWKHWENMKF